VYWNHRMFLLHGESKYIDILEKSLYNGLISGVGMDGKSFFYTNAMEIKSIYSHKDMEAERSGWFTCSCCPTNITRLIPSVPGYVYAQKNSDIYINLFVSGNASFTINKNTVDIEQKNNYPWDGNLVFNINPKSAATFNLLVRLPGWSRNEAMPSDLYKFESLSDKKVSITINGKAAGYTVTNGYAVLSKTWKKGDLVQVNLPMEVRRVIANQNIKDDIGKVSVQRGPLMYCAEWPDNNGKTSNIILPNNAQFSTEFKSDLLHGVTVIKSQVPAIVISGNSVSTVNQSFTAIPYYAWAHRGKGEMEVWFPQEVKNIDILSK
jgi:DUF1680 family protein